MPYPPDKGERIRAFQEIKALSKDFHITLAALAHSKMDYESAGAIRQWCERVVLAPAGGKMGLVRGILGTTRGGSITEGYFSSRYLAKLLKKLTNEVKYPIALAYSSSMLPYLLKANVAHRVIDLVDADSAKWYAYADEASWPKKWVYQREGKTVRRLEEDAIISCDAVLVVSDAEAGVLGGYTKKISVLGNGVDTDHFKVEDISHDRRASLVFTGTMNYRPNIEGVCWFVDNVWPELKRRKSELKFYIVGRDPTPAVRRLAKYSDVEVTGTVNDVRPYLASAGVAICPLRMARGIQNKVLEAMAMERAVVSTGPALEGLEVEIGKDVLQADTPEQWQESIISLLENESFRIDLGRNARKCVEDKYNWDIRMAPLVTLCRKLAEKTVEAKEVSKTTLPAAARHVFTPKKQKPLPVNRKAALALWFMTFMYLIILAYGSLLPSGKRLPFIGVWDASLSSTLQNMLHMPAYALLMICISLSMSATLRNRPLAVILSVLTSFSIGIFMEHAQGSVAGRTVSNVDILLNGAGIALALPAALAWRWKEAPSNDQSKQTSDT